MTMTYGATKQTKAAPRPVTVSHLQLVRILLYLASYVTLFRSTAMGYGYTTYVDFGQMDYALLGALNYVVAALVALYIVFDGPFVARKLLHSPSLLLFAALLLVTVVGSDDPMVSLRSFGVMLIITAPILALPARFGPASTFDVLRNFCSFAIILNLAYAIIFPQYAFQGGLNGILRGMFIHKNAFGTFMAVALVFALPKWRGLHLRSLQIKELVHAAACVIALLFLVLSRSASAWVMVAVFPCLYIGLRLILSIRNVYHRAAAWLFAVISTAFAVSFAYLFLFEELLLQLGRDATLTNRTKIWGSLFHLASDRPWLGHGFGIFSRPEAFAMYWGEFGWDATSTHNSYLELLLNIGYIPLAALAVIMARSMWSEVVGIRGDPRPDQLKRQVIVVLVLISALTEAYRLLGGTFFWLAFVVCLFVDRQEDRTAGWVGRADRPGPIFSPRLASTIRVAAN